ncbi:MAG: hypothetical protein F6K24_11030 [Okeania sp. SIO2D1]|nr:hypothetical protein [Okeania sp. SIO2D1]
MILLTPSLPQRHTYLIQRSPPRQPPGNLKLKHSLEHHKKMTPKVELGLPSQTNCYRLMLGWFVCPYARLFIQHKTFPKIEKTAFNYHTNNLLSKQEKTTKEKLVILSKENSEKDRARQRQNRN